MSSLEEKVNNILSSKKPIDIVLSKIARKSFPDFDILSTDKKLEILEEINKSSSKLLSTLPNHASEIIEKRI